MTPPNVQFIPSSSSATLLYTVSGTMQFNVQTRGARVSIANVSPAGPNGYTTVNNFVLRPDLDQVRLIQNFGSSLGAGLVPWTTMVLVHNGNTYPLSSSGVHSVNSAIPNGNIFLNGWENDWSSQTARAGDTATLYIYG
jgi:hypothetical protein